MVVLLKICSFYYVFNGKIALKAILLSVHLLAQTLILTMFIRSYELSALFASL